MTEAPWDAFAERPGPLDRISANFRCADLVRSELAVRRGIDNGFADLDALRAAVYLCRTLLQPLADAFGAFRPNSVYRSQALERALKGKPAGWVSASQHTKGEACDLGLPGLATLELAQWAAAHLPYDQIICECYDPAEGAHSGWVHVSLRPPGRGANRRQLLSYVRNRRGQYAYVEGLKADV